MIAATKLREQAITQYLLGRSEIGIRKLYKMYGESKVRSTINSIING